MSLHLVVSVALRRLYIGPLNTIRILLIFSSFVKQAQDRSGLSQLIAGLKCIIRDEEYLFDFALELEKQLTTHCPQTHGTRPAISVP